LEEKSNYIIELKDIHTYYGNSHVIQGLSLFLEKGEAVSILGKNGVGKTTTLRSIIGLNPPKLGRVIIDGEDVTNWPVHKIINKGIGYIPAERHIFPGLTVEENLKIAKRASNIGNYWDLDRVYNLFPRLRERRKQDGATLSGGEQQMLTIGRCLMGNPKIMLLDEPSQGLAPVIVAEVVKSIIDLWREHRITLLIVEQNFRIALKLAQRHYLMEIKGRIKNHLTTEEIMNNEDIIKKHLAI